MAKIVSWRERYEAEAVRIISALEIDELVSFYLGDDPNVIAYYRTPEGASAFRKSLCEEWVPEASDDTLTDYVDGHHQKWDHYDQTWYTDDTWFQMYKD